MNMNMILFKNNHSYALYIVCIIISINYYAHFSLHKVYLYAILNSHEIPAVVRNVFTNYWFLLLFTNYWFPLCVCHSGKYRAPNQMKSLNLPFVLFAFFTESCTHISTLSPITDNFEVFSRSSPPITPGQQQDNDVNCNISDHSV